MDGERRMTMPTIGIDHIAVPTANAERLIAFYKRLGFLINHEEEWRAGKRPSFSIQVGDSKINVHPEGYTANLRGPTAVPGCMDICFVFEGTVEECQKMLQEAGVPVILGPVPRPGGRSRGTVPSLSLYARDPDDNLLEWMIYQDTTA
jgi:catechol 2,3-dioxygenase-like lactoylglutathione lyase family enzyme